MSGLLAVVGFLALMFAGGASTALGFYVTAKWLQKAKSSNARPAYSGINWKEPAGMRIIKCSFHNTSPQ